MVRKSRALPSPENTQNDMIKERPVCGGHDMVDMHAWLKYNIEQYILNVELVDARSQGRKEVKNTKLPKGICETFLEHRAFFISNHKHKRRYS